MGRWSFVNALLGPLRDRAETPALIVIGLGNPGPDYADSRHNVGFWFIDSLASRNKIAFSRKNRSTLVGEGETDGYSIVLAKPRTYVNNSGEAARYLLARFRTTPDRLLLVYDDIDLPTGKIRLRPSGSPGSHNGARSVTDALGTRKFPRLRVGVGKPDEGDDQIAYVLGSPNQVEKRQLNTALGQATEALKTILSAGVTEAMNRFN